MGSGQSVTGSYKSPIPAIQSIEKQQIVPAEAKNRNMKEEWKNVELLEKKSEFLDSSVDEKNIDSWNFSIWSLGHDDLISLSILLLKKHNLLEEYNIPLDKWAPLLLETGRLMSYHNNPYHNFHHVLDVAQTCSVFLSKFSAEKWLLKDEILGLMLSALFHDLEHPGTNNIYQINASSPLAIRYNDVSVLENYHCAKAFELFNLNEFNIFINIAPDKRKSLRKIMITLILCTDMSVHFALKDELDNCWKKYIPAGSNFVVIPSPSEIPEKDRTTILKSIMHTADISNPAKPWELSKKWSDLVLEEFFNQGDREKRENLPVSMNCDRSTTFQDELSLNFADFIVVPFFFSLVKAIPKSFLSCKILGDNRNIWHNELIKRLSEKPKDGGGIDEIISKWEARKSGFEEKMKDIVLIEQSLG